MCFTCRKWSNMYVIDSECRSSEAEDFESFVPFCSTLVPRIANIRDRSRHRFRQRSWSVFMRWNWSDFHQFSWSPGFCDIIFIDELNLFTPKADFLFLTLKSWFFSCMQPANITHIHFHSLWQAPTPQTFKIKKNPYYGFHWLKISFTTFDWSDTHFSSVKNHPTYQNLCSLWQIIIAWSIS